MRVPWVLPIRSGDQVFPEVGRKPAVVRVTLGLKENTPTEMMRFWEIEGQKILDKRRPQLLGFYRSTNMNLQSGVVPVMARHMQFDEGMAHYHANNGTEILDVIIYPDLAYNPDKKALDFQYDYLEFRLEWSNDDGGDTWQEDYQDDLPNLNEDRFLVVRAKVRSPKKVRKDLTTYIDVSQHMDKNDPTLPVYKPEQVDSAFSYSVGSFDHTWVGYEMATGWAVKQKDGSPSGKFWLLGAQPGVGGTPDKKHATSYLVDLRAFEPDDEIDIELRAYWANTASDDESPIPDVKVTYRLWSGGKMYWPPNDRKEIKPLTHWVDYIKRRAKDQVFYQTVNGVKMGPFKYRRLYGAAAEGLGGDGTGFDAFRHPAWEIPPNPIASGGPIAGRETFTFDYSQHREAIFYEESNAPEPPPHVPTNDLYMASFPNVNTPGYYFDTFELGLAYDQGSFDYDTTRPEDRQFLDPQHKFVKFGMYAFFTPTSPATVFAGDPPSYQLLGNPKTFTWPDGFSVAIFVPSENDGPFGYEMGLTTRTCYDRQKIVWNTFKADCFYNTASSTEGELRKSKQVNSYDENTLDHRTNVGEYFGNIKYLRGSVTFDDKKGADPELEL